MEGRRAGTQGGRRRVGRVIQGLVARQNRRRFWAAVARGLSSEAAGVEAGVPPGVGSRWFREGGGMPTVSQAPPSGRYLSLAEREEIAILRAGGHGVREIARRLGRSPSTISRELDRNAPARGRVPRHGRAAACRASRAATEDREARGEREAARLRAGAARRSGPAAGRRGGARPRGQGMEGPQQAAP